MNQLAPDGRIVACLPIAAQPSTTQVTTITLTAGQPHVDTVTFGGYAQSTATPVVDALTLPGRWVDHHTGHPDPAWKSIGWRDHDDPQHTGARTALHLLRNPGHTETYHRAPLDWPSWTTYSVIAGESHRSIAALDDGKRGIGHTTATTAAVILTDGTILADSTRSPSLTALRSWLHRWKRAGRPDAGWFHPRLVPNDGEDLPGWDYELPPASPCDARGHHVWWDSPPLTRRAKGGQPDVVPIGTAACSSPPSARPDTAWDRPERSRRCPQRPGNAVAYEPLGLAQWIPRGACHLRLLDRSHISAGCGEAVPEVEMKVFRFAFVGAGRHFPVFDVHGHM